jgi:outer membrane protein OmpA-like peptidoglycan-associated protein/Tol biopolymer transport system component
MKKLVFLLSFIPLFSFGQMTEEEIIKICNEGNEPELVQLSSQMLQSNYLYHAEIVINKLLTMKPESANYNYRKGFVMLRSRNDYANAKTYLLKAINNVSKNYDMYSPREESAPVDAYYHLARSFHLNEEIGEAKKYYGMFLDNSTNQSGTNDLADLGLIQCDVAEREIGNPKSAIVKNIGGAVNTEFPEYSPVVSLDGSSLYFTTRRKWDDGSTDDELDPMTNLYPEDIYVSYADFEGEWTSPERLSFCDGKYNEATISVSADERRIFVYEDMSGGGDIYFSDFGEHKFEELEKLDYNDVNSEHWETHCTMTPDKQHMYFVSDRPGGYGGRDIYRLTRLPNGEWSQAQNMGPTINTPYDEDAPFIAVNNKTLYFASNGPTSMGGFDIFVSFVDEDGVWSTPANMGYPINSTGDDIFYTTTIDGLKGYLTSFRKDGFGEKDIYEIQNDYLGNRPISSLRGKFISSTGQPLPEGLSVKIVCPTCELEDDKMINPRIKNDAYFAVLQRCKDYKIEFYQNGELLESRDFVTLCNNENEEIIENYYIGKYLLAGTVSDLETLALLQDSKVELVNPSNNEVIATYNTDSKGEFESNYLEDKVLGDKIELLVRVSKEGYLSQTFIVDTTLGEWNKLQLDYLISKPTIGGHLEDFLALEPIYFDLDKSNIRPDAALVLDKIVQIMNDNPTLEVELGSHTDCRATKSYNMALSSRRARSSAAYIKKRITNPSRIYGKGYGESQLVNDCGCEGNVVSDCSDEEHQANRRTEFKIVKK